MITDNDYYHITEIHSHVTVSTTSLNMVLAQ